MNHKKVFFGRVDTHRLKDQVVVVEPADEKLKAELEKEVGQGPGFADIFLRRCICRLRDTAEPLSRMLGPE